ncbi:hypothetical protein [Thermococcus zilligii]|uniref:hypothetical protein n=1 Tax=Thermococcus zilligii TaxID=54076 RepID=UPI001ED90238|nr:hypothetical protein [Thermococcus zilligii]
MKTLVAVPTFKGGLDDEVRESLVRAETFTLVEVEGGAVRQSYNIENGLPERQDYPGLGGGQDDCPCTPMKVGDALRELR